MPDALALSMKMGHVGERDTPVLRHRNGDAGVLEPTVHDQRSGQLGRERSERISRERKCFRIAGAQHLHCLSDRRRRGYARVLERTARGTNGGGIRDADYSDIRPVYLGKRLDAGGGGYEISALQ